MSAFDLFANPGKIPTAFTGGRITPETLFRNSAEKSQYQDIISAKKGTESLKVSKVKVCIFDLSDSKQRKEYEKLEAELIEKVSRMEAIVESSRDLVKRADGTSYWMKYIEYVEFGASKK